MVATAPDTVLIARIREMSVSLGIAVRMARGQPTGWDATILANFWEQQYNEVLDLLAKKLGTYSNVKGAL